MDFSRNSIRENIHKVISAVSPVAKKQRIERHHQMPMKKDIFRARRPNTSRPASVHVDDFVKSKQDITTKPEVLIRENSRDSLSSSSSSTPSSPNIWSEKKKISTSVDITANTNQRDIDTRYNIHINDRERSHDRKQNYHHNDKDNTFLGYNTQTNDNTTSRERMYTNMSDPYTRRDRFYELPPPHRSLKSHNRNKYI